MKKTLPFLLIFLSSVVFANNKVSENTVTYPKESVKNVRIIITEITTNYEPEKTEEIIKKLATDETTEETVKKLNINSKNNYTLDVNPTSKENINYSHTNTHSYISEIVSKKDINDKEIIETVSVSSITEGVKMDINIYKYNQKNIDININFDLKKLISMKKEGKLEFPTLREESFNQTISLPFNKEKFLNARYSNLDNKEYKITLIKIVKE